MRSQRMRLAGIGQLGSEEFVEAVVDLIGHCVEQFNAFDHTHLAPLTIHRRTRRLHGSVDLSLTGFVHETNHMIVGRCAVFESLAGGDEFAVNEVVELFHGASSLNSEFFVT